MQNSIRNLWIAVVVVGIIAIIGIFTPVGQSVVKALGGVTNYDEVDTTALKVGGSSGSRVGPIITGTCTMIGMDVSQAASTTAPYDCAVTGVVSGDNVIALMSTTTINGLNQVWSVQAAKASTTAGFITVLWRNNGAAVAPSTLGVGSSTQYLILHPVSSVPGL